MKRIFVVAALIISSQLYAQDSALLENLTVTANRYATKTTETGKVVITISRQQLEKAGSRDLAQVITELGGVFINGYTSNAGKEKNIYVRGAKVDYTLIAIDGVPVYDASGIGSNFDIRYIPVDNVERIEILKGSQSTLYGSDAIAGVINIITRKGGSKPFGVNGTAHYGSYNTWRASAGINGAVKKFDYNLSYTHFSTSGFSEAQQPYNATTPFIRNGYRQNAVQAAFGIEASKNYRLQPYFRYSKNGGSIDNGAFIDEADFTYDANNLQSGIRNIFSLGKGRLNVAYQYTKTNRNYLDDSAKSRNGFYLFNQSAYKAAEHFAEAFYVHPFGAVTLTAGADLRSSNTDFSALQISPYGTDKAAQSGDSVKQSQAGVYAAINYSSRGFSIEGGGRYNHHSTYGANAAFNINPTYFIAKQVKLFANVSSGFKTPSLYQLFSEYGNKDLKPETALNIEGGVHVFSGDGKASVRLTYFNRDVKEVIAFFYNTATFQSKYINQDQQKDRGLELDGSLKLTDKIALRAFYSYVDGKITTKQSGKDTTYFNLLRRPKSNINIIFSTQITPALYASLNLNAVGLRRDVYFDPATFRSVPISLNSYTLVNFYAECKLPKTSIKLFADMRNLFDESYADIYGYNTAGFNAYGGLRLSF